MNTAAPPTSPKASNVSPLAAITSDLDELTPRFDVDANAIEIIRSPTEFYETLKVCCSSCLNDVQRLTRSIGQDRKCKAKDLPINAVCWCRRIRVGTKI